MLELSSKSKEPKPSKEKKIYYSSRGGAGRSKSAGPVNRKPVVSSAPSKVLEVPVPVHKTTSTGRGGSANSRTFVVEEGTFERVMEHEAGRIRAIKSAETRKTMSLRGGSVIPEAKKKEISPTSTQISTQYSDDTSSSKSIVNRFPRVPSFGNSFFSREQPSSPVPLADSPIHESRRPSLGVVTNSPQVPTTAARHCPTCQCWRHTVSTQASADYNSPNSPVGGLGPSPPPSPFKAVFPGVLLYVPEEPHANGPPSPTASSIYSGLFRDSFTTPELTSRTSRV